VREARERGERLGHVYVGLDRDVDRIVDKCQVVPLNLFFVGLPF